MKDAGCLGPLKEIVIEKLEAAYYKGTLDINTLSESLGREKVWLFLQSLNYYKFELLPSFV